MAHEREMKKLELNQKIQEMKQRNEESSDFDSQWVEAAAEGNLKKLTLLSKNIDELSLDCIQMGHDIAKDEGIQAAIRVTQLALNKKQKSVELNQVKASPAEKQQPSSKEPADLDTQWMEAVSEGNVKKLTTLIKSIDEISHDIIQLSHEMAEDEDIQGVTRWTQFALNKKQKVQTRSEGSAATTSNKYNIQTNAKLGNTGSGKFVNMTGDNMNLTIN